MGHRTALRPAGTAPSATRCGHRPCAPWHWPSESRWASGGPRPCTACSGSSWWTWMLAGAGACSAATGWPAACTCPSTCWTSPSSSSHSYWQPQCSMDLSQGSYSRAPWSTCHSLGTSAGTVRPSRRQEPWGDGPVTQAGVWGPAAARPEASLHPGSRYEVSRGWGWVGAVCTEIGRFGKGVNGWGRGSGSTPVHPLTQQVSLGTDCVPGEVLGAGSWGEQNKINILPLGLMVRQVNTCSAEYCPEEREFRGKFEKASLR